MVGSKFTVFALFSFAFEGKFPCIICSCDLAEGFCAGLGGLYMEGLIFGILRYLAAG